MTVDQPKRSIAKAITWRVSGSLATAIMVYLATEEIQLALVVGGLEAFIKMILYYIHERAWERIDFGRVKLEMSKMATHDNSLEDNKKKSA